MEELPQFLGLEKLENRQKFSKNLKKSKLYKKIAYKKIASFMKKIIFFSIFFSGDADVGGVGLQQEWGATARWGQ